MKIEVLDSLPGTGKSTAIFKWMKSNKQEKYIYVSPLLSEVENRIPVACDGMNFVYPTSESGTKSEDILKLIGDGENIACTHSLFLMMGKEHWDLINQQGYILILDEEICVIEGFKAKRGDLPLMVKDGKCSIEGNYSKVVLNTELSEFEDTSLKYIAVEAYKGTLYTSKNKNQYDFLVTQIPIDLLKAAKKTVILTYMFEGSILDKFLELHNITWSKFNEVKLFKTNEEVIANLKDLITFKTNRAFGAVSRYSLSVSWYEKATRAQLDAVGSVWRSVARSVPDGRLLCTMPKVASQRGSRGVGRPRDRAVAGSWLWAGTRATNDYADKDVVLHLYNRYPHQSVSTYFQSHGLPLDADKFALSEMIQFVFRSAIRKGEKIDLYVASPRMLKLFQDWLNGAESEPESVLEAATFA